MDGGCARKRETGREELQTSSLRPPSPAAASAPSVRPPDEVRTCFTQQWEPIKQTNPLLLPRKTRNHTKVSKPECNSGRAERAGGRSCSDFSRTKHSLLSRHGRTSRTVAHGNLSCICVYPYCFTRVICEDYDERVLILELDHQREEITCISRRVVCSHRTKKRGIS